MIATFEDVFSTLFPAVRVHELDPVESHDARELAEAQLRTLNDLVAKDPALEETVAINTGRLTGAESADFYRGALAFTQFLIQVGVLAGGNRDPRLIPKVVSSMGFKFAKVYLAKAGAPQ